MPLFIVWLTRVCINESDVLRDFDLKDMFSLHNCHFYDDLFPSVIGIGGGGMGARFASFEKNSRVYKKFYCKTDYFII